MADKRSMAEALQRNKRLRQQLDSGKTDTSSDLTLAVVTGTTNGTADHQSDEPACRDRRAQTTPAPSTSLAPAPPSVWVRHTLGLRPQTSVELRDATDTQKQKKRRGLLKPGEPANEQEIAELGINLALRQLGYRSSAE